MYWSVHPQPEALPAYGQIALSSRQGVTGETILRGGCPIPSSSRRAVWISRNWSSPIARSGQNGSCSWFISMKGCRPFRKAGHQERGSWQPPDSGLVGKNTPPDQTKARSTRSRLAGTPSTQQGRRGGQTQDSQSARRDKLQACGPAVSSLLPRRGCLGRHRTFQQQFWFLRNIRATRDVYPCTAAHGGGPDEIGGNGTSSGPLFQDCEPRRSRRQVVRNEVKPGQNGTSGGRTPSRKVGRISYESTILSFHHPSPRQILRNKANLARGILEAKWLAGNKLRHVRRAKSPGETKPIWPGRQGRPAVPDGRKMPNEPNSA